MEKTISSETKIIVQHAMNKDFGRSLYDHFCKPYLAKIQAQEIRQEKIIKKRTKKAKEILSIYPSYFSSTSRKEILDKARVLLLCFNADNPKKQTLLKINV